MGGKIVYEPEAVSYTKAPDRPFSLISQRYRWWRGTVQVLRKYFIRTTAKQHILSWNLLAWIGMTYLFEFSILPVINVFGLATLLMVLASGADLAPMGIWLAIFLLMNLCVTAFCTAIHRDSMKLAVTLPFYDFYQGIFLSSGWVIAMIDEFRGRKMRW